MKIARPAILVIDDQPLNLRSILSELARENYEVATAGSGAEGMVKLFERDYAVILMDIDMPLLNGTETANLIRARGIDTPILFLMTCDGTGAYPKRNAVPGAVDYLFKPLNAEALRGKLRFFIEIFRKTRSLERENRLLSAQADRRFRDLVEGLRNGIVWSARVGVGRFDYVSPTAFEISGYPTSQWLSEKYFMISHSSDEDREGMATTFTELNNTRRDTEFEHRFICADGKTIWLHTTIRLAEDGKEYRGLSVDITQLKETEESLREAIRVRDDFLSIASHELRTPLTPLKLQIDGFRRLLKRGELAKVPERTIARMLEVSDNQVQSLSRLVDQLLDVAQIKSGRFPMQMAVVDLVPLVRHVTTLFRVPATLRMPTAAPVRGDGARLEQVLVNLMDNAAKYGLGKPISVNIECDRTATRLTLSDSGIGIESNAHERIFKRFERAVSNRNYSGMGLGLYICQEIIDLHGGKIEVRSAPGSGSAFTLHLPH